MLCSVELVSTSEHNYCDTDVSETIVSVSLKSPFKIQFSL